MKSVVLITAIITLSSVQFDACAESDATGQIEKSVVYLEGYGLGVVEALDGLGKMDPVKKEPNRHNSKVQDDILLERLPGVEITWLRPGPKPERRLLQSLALTRSDRPISASIGIGRLNETNIINWCGRPRDRDLTVPNKKVLIYYSPYQETGVTEIEFHLKDGILERIEWKWPID